MEGWHMFQACAVFFCFVTQNTIFLYANFYFVKQNKNIFIQISILSYKIRIFLFKFLFCHTKYDIFYEKFAKVHFFL